MGTRSSPRPEGVQTVPQLARIARIVRHPVKGLPGHDLDGTRLSPGRGVPGDRVFAFARRPVPAGGGWASTRHFHTLCAAPDPADGRVRIDEDAREATLTHPVWSGLTVPLDPPSPGKVADTDWFGGAELHRAREGYCDDRGTVSLVNLASVEALAETVGRPVDPLRLRANLLLAGLPAWAELDLPGARLTAGDAELEVLHPINRCAATSVVPGRAHRDLNVPAELATRFGHLYCGLRARVVRAGTVRGGDPVELTGRGRPTPLHGGPGPRSWPRRARVDERVRHGDGAVSLWLTDPLAGERDAPRPGQHVVVTAHTPDGPLWRAYTVSAHDADRLRITVKREPSGRMSSYLHSHARPGTLLTLSGPHGGTVLDDEPGRPLLLASAGIGITQTVALLRGCAAEQPARRVEVVHTARRPDDLALWPEVLALAERLPHARTRLHLTRTGDREAAEWHAERGRPVLDDADPAATAFLCGPPSFLETARRALTTAGIPAERVHQEVFVSPGSSGITPQEPPEGPFKVSFSTSGRVARWQPADGSLSELAEAQGLTVPSGCRAGACRSCARPLRGGRVVYPTPPALPPDPGTALLCVAVPAEDTDIDL